MGLRDMVGAASSLVTGLGVTLKNLWRKPVTERYPHAEPELSPKFRSAIKLLRFDETNTHDCIACMQCVRICPSFCITVEGTRHEGVKGKRAEAFLVDYALCSVCGLCIDVCPTDTLGYSKVYDMVSFERDGFTFDLLDGFREDEAAHVKQLQVKAKAEAEAKARAKAEAEAKKAAEAKTGEAAAPGGEAPDATDGSGADAGAPKPGTPDTPDANGGTTSS